MDNLNQIKTLYRPIYESLDNLHLSLSKTSNPDLDSLPSLYSKALDALSNHRNVLLSVLQESLKKRKLDQVSNNSKRLKSNFEPGDSVAMKHEKVWILAIVGKYLPNLEKYQVIDAEDSKEYISDPSDIIKLSISTEFPLGTQVLALFPGSSCFYNAKVVRVEKDDYILLFEDDQGLERRVEKRFVLNQT